jgi:hypothetical protein
LMRKCGAIKANGERCGRIVGASQVYCYAHDPSNADKRSRDAAKAGRSTPNSELKEIKASLKGLTEKVLTGGVDTGPAAIANQLMNTQLRIIELERRWKETGELEGRMEALEDVLKGRKTG